MRRVFFTCIVTLSFCLLFRPVCASAEPVALTADEISYNYQDKQLDAAGNVKITYQDIMVESDSVIIDQEQQILLAMGQVHVTKNNQDFKGDRFLYYLKTKQGLISPFNATISDSELKSPAILNADETYLKGEEIRSKNATFTGCDLEHPHYHLSAKQLEYYPDDRLVFHGVWYWEGKIPLLYLPILYISLKEEKDNSSVQLLENKTEGWILLLGYLYYLNDSTYGVIHTRLTQKGGNDLGGRLYYQPSAKNRFYVDYSLLDKGRLGIPEDDYFYGLGYEYWDSSSSSLLKRVDSVLTSWNKYSEPGRSHLNGFQLNLSGVSPFPDSIKINYNSNDDPGVMWQLFDTQATWSYSPDKTLRTSFTGRKSYETRVNEVPKDKFQYSFSLTKNWTWSNLSLKYENTAIVNSNYSFNNVTPDIVYTIPKLTLPVLGDIKLTSEYLHMEKFPSGETGDRLACDLQKTVALNNYKIGKLGELQLNTDGLLQYRYFSVNDAGSNIGGFTSRLNLTDKFNNYFKTDFRLGYTFSQGTNSMFFSDNILPGFSLENGWYWKSPTFDASISTKYNFQRKYADPLNFKVGWTPATKQQFVFSTLYDWKNGFGQTNLDINYSPKEDWKLMLSLGYNFNNSLRPWSSRNFGADILQPLGANWRLELSTHYDMFYNQFSKAVIGIGYNWHCRDLFLHYDYLKNEYWLQMSFNIYPGQKFRLIDSNGLLEYYMQMLY